HCLRSERTWNRDHSSGLRHLLRFELPVVHDARSIESAMGLHAHAQHATGRTLESMARLSRRESISDPHRVSQRLSVPNRRCLRLRTEGCKSHIPAAMEPFIAKTIGLRLAGFRFIFGEQDNASMARA